MDTAESKNTPPPRWPVLRQLRERISRCPDSEGEQALIRIGLGAAVLLYLYGVGVFTDVDDRVTLLLHRTMGAAFFFLAWVILLSILLHPVRSVPRRACSMLTDLSFTTYAMYGAGPYGAPLFIVYLWVTFGNGLRYGTHYLYGAMALSTTGFAAVLVTSEYWSGHLALGAGVLVGLIVLPLYASTLITRLNEAIARAEKANEAKNTFLANMSHELRTPLNGVVALSDLLANTPLGREQRDVVQTIYTSARTLLAIVEDLLDISRIEVGKIVIENAEFDLPLLIDSTSKMLAPQAVEKCIDLSTHVGSDIPPLLHGDARHLRQVLINLVGNAVKFTERGSVEVRVTRPAGETTNPDQVSLRFEVIDTGIGISPEAQKKIFEPFTQADESTTRRYGGTGLGTTIAKRLVELMGGEMGLQSSPGQGSRFWFTLDFHAVAPTEAHVPAVTSGVRAEADHERNVTYLPERPAGSRVMRPLHILVAEDNPVNQKLMTLILERAGHHVHLVADGEQALAALAERHYELAIVDLHMPQTDGIETIKIHRFAHSDRYVPFIVLTANATADALRECEQAGADAFLTKPIEARQLTDTIAEVMSRAQPRADRSQIISIRPEQASVSDTSGCSVLERERLLELGQLRGVDAIKSLLGVFMLDAEELAQMMRDAVKKGAQAHFKELAHALAGSAANVGAARIRDLCDRARRLPVVEFAAGAVPLLDELQSELALFREQAAGFGRDPSQAATHT